MVPLVVMADNYRDDELTWHRAWPLMVTSVGGFILLNVAYTSAYQDAQRATVEYNERRDAEFHRRHPEAP